MKIIYLDQYFNTPSMPGGTRSYEMAKRLIELGHDVYMITSWRNDSATSTKEWFTTNESGITVHWYPIPYSNKMNFYERIVSFLTYVFAATFRASKIKADVLFATSTPLTIAIPAIIASKLNRLPMVFEVRDLWPEVPIALGILKNPILIIFSKWLEKLAYYFANEVVALAPGMKEAILKVNKNSNVTVIPNGCDFNLFDSPTNQNIAKKFAWLGDKKIILYPGTIGRVNNVEYLASIAKEMLEIDPNIVFVIVGDGIMVESVTRIASEYSILNKNFFLIGEVTKKEIVEWFKISTIIAVFYKAPPCATQNSVQNKFFDALSAGKPVVFEHNGWSVNMLESNGGAIRIPDSNPSKAAEIISANLHDTNWYKNACSVSKKLGKESFDRDNLARNLEKILQKSLNNLR